MYLLISFISNIMHRHWIIDLRHFQAVYLFRRRPGSSYSDWLRAGRSGDLIPVGAKFSAPIQTGSGAHPASCTTGTGSFPGVESGRAVTLTPHPTLVPRSKNRVQLYPYCPYGPSWPPKNGETCHIWIAFKDRILTTRKPSFL
jgi:hypothetical protein